MIIKTDYNVIVIVGLWNAAIFNPNWVSRYLLPGEKSLNVEFSLNVPCSPRVSSGKLRIYVIGNKLNFVPLDAYDETFEAIETLAIKTADYLLHTPVTAFGVNFLFETTGSDNLPVQLLKLNDGDKLTEFGASIKKSHHRNTLEIDGKTLNLAITTENESKAIFDFNFNFNISDLTEFKEQIHLNPILKLKALALDMMRDVYNLGLTNEGSKNG